LVSAVLHDYGIQTEHSHVRAHVCPVVKRVYVYPTECGVQAIESGHYRRTSGFQKGIEGATAEGFLVPPMDIRNIVALAIADRAWQSIGFRDSDSLGAKGEKAMRLVCQMIKQGLFPVPFVPLAVDDYNMQLDGMDIVISQSAMPMDDIIVQVKCDYAGGEKHLGGTGNLFLQVAERNPLGIC